MCGRIVPLLPNETMFNNIPMSRTGSTQDDIKETLELVSCLQLRTYLQ